MTAQSTVSALRPRRRTPGFVDGVQEGVRFVGLMALIAFVGCYIMALFSILSAVADPANGSGPLKAWGAGTLASLLVIVTSFRGAKAMGKPTGVNDTMRSWAWSQNLEYYSDAPPEGTDFKRLPLSALVVARSGPAVRKTLPPGEGVAVVRGTLPDADGAAHRIGDCVAWHGVTGKLPALTFVRGDFDPALMANFGDQELDMSEYDLVFDWRVFGTAEHLDEIITLPLEHFLNSNGDSGVVIQLESDRVVVWGDRRSTVDDIAKFRRLAGSFQMCLPPHLRNGGDAVEEAAPEDPGAVEEAEFEASLGALASASVLRGRLFAIMFTLFVPALCTLIALFYYSQGVLAHLVLGQDRAGEDGTSAADLRSWLIAFWIVAALAVMTAGPTLVAYAKDRRLRAKHKAIALQVRAVARATDLVFSPRALFLETGWTRRPFSTLKHMGAAPCASAHRSWGSIGVAYIEGDVGTRRFLIRTFQSRVAWAHVGAGLPRADFVREGFSTRAAKLIGGTELDTESYAFNRLWRIKTDNPQEAHAMLQPLMIEFLTAAAESGISIHLDGDRVVVWDDGSDESIDLSARLDLVERFVACLPGHLRT